jgi:hypothetical protein
MTRRIRILLQALVLVSVLPAMTWAESAPFIVLRFNQSRIYYEQPLYNAVAKAVAMKPEVMFDVVSFRPRSGDTALRKAWQQRAATNMQQVVATLNTMGVPSSRLSLRYAEQSDIRYDEVHITAR